MRTSDLLYVLSAEQVRGVARRLGYTPSNLSKQDLISWISRSLPKIQDADGNARGWAGALEDTIQSLIRSELLSALDRVWPSESGESYDPSADALASLGVAALRDLLEALLTAEDEDPSITIADVVANPRWPGCFEICDIDAMEADDEEEAPLSIDEDSAALWRSTPILEVGGTDALPTGLTKDSRVEQSHQTEAIRRLVAWRTDPSQSGVLCMPTGSGKTWTSVKFILENVAAAGATVLWLTHRDELMDQAVSTFATNAWRARRPLRVGRYQAGQVKADESVDVLVASISTLVRGESLQRLLSSQHPLSLIIIDECHHSVARTWRSLILKLKQRHRNAKILGLSATPTRTNDREQAGFWKIFENIIHEVHALELIKSRVLARPRFVPVATGSTVAATAKDQREYRRFNDIPPALAKRIAANAERNKVIVNHYLRHRDELGPTLVFAMFIAQAEELVRLFVKAGVNASVLSASSTYEERRNVIQAFRAGTTPVLVNVTLFSEGTDLPGVTAVFIARPTKSRILFAQMVGRGLRGPAVGGTSECTIVAFHDTVTNLIEESFTTTFTDEREALEALGLAEPPVATPEPPASVASVRSLKPRADEATLRARMQAMLEHLSDGPRTVHVPDATPIALLGWWQIDAEVRRRYLPVYAPDAETIRAAVMSVDEARRDGRPANKEPNPCYCPVTYLDKFLTLLSRSLVPPIYVPIEITEIEERERFARAILDGGDGPTATAALPSEPQRVTTPVRVRTAPMAAFPDLVAGSNPASLEVPPAKQREQTLQTAAFPDMRVTGSGAAPGELRTPSVEDQTPATERIDPAVLARFSSDNELRVDLDGGGTVELTTEHYAALRTAWTMFVPLLPKDADPTNLRLFVAMVGRMPALAAFDARSTEEVLIHAAKTGSIPPVSNSANRADVEGVRKGLKTVPRAERAKWLDAAYRRSFQGEYPDLASFLVDLLE